MAIIHRRGAQQSTAASVYRYAGVPCRTPAFIPEGQDSLDLGMSCSVKGLESTTRHVTSQADRQSRATAA